MGLRLKSHGARGSPARWIHNTQSIKDLSERINHKPTSWVNKLRPSWSLMIYGDERVGVVLQGSVGRALVGGFEFIASR